MFSITLKYH